MSHVYKINVIHNGETVQVYPQQPRYDSNFEDVCKRIGMMVMSSGITTISVYRDDKLHRTAEVTMHSDFTER